MKALCYRYSSAYGTVDAQVSYKIPKSKSSIRLGGTNRPIIITVPVMVVLRWFVLCQF